jgi:hypothetical protein
VRCAAAKPRVNAEKLRFFINAHYLPQRMRMPVSAEIVSGYPDLNRPSLVDILQGTVKYHREE